MRVQMLGLCRFSYLGEDGFQAGPQTLDQRRAFLYDPERLARRWFWFENLVLPGLLAQSDKNFTLVLMTGPDLPDPYMSQLHELTRICPQFRLSLVPPMAAHHEAGLAAIAPHIDPRADVVGHFRQDDDDAVALDYIEQARDNFDMMRRLWRYRGRLYCDYSRGLILRPKPEGVAVEVRIIHCAAAALTVFLPPDAGRCILHYPHWKIMQSMPGVTLAGPVMYARTLTQDSDSGAVGAGFPLDGSRQNWKALLAERFRVDLPSIDEGARAMCRPGT